MARSRQARVVRRLEDASKVVRATSGLLRHTSGLLRQLVMMVGWLVLLAGSVRLLLDPPAALSLAHFLTPGAGAVAVVQGLLRPPARWWPPEPPAPALTLAETRPDHDSARPGGRS
ncbi:hypothetical protein [Sphaerisporangium corydalis]|uniref:DUF3040 domain-containing protein n=1 Tax=Sphaerisporangium corydalis TaxID=1441875 RepID=A0ABV9EUP2_9ACTN|nr:hypothetical protein [Sphaerisporangium corydalis]